MTTRLVSILITAHNAAFTIAETLRTVGAQQLPAGTELEVVVVDDRSSDGTLAAAERAAPPGSCVLRVDVHQTAERTARQQALVIAARASHGDVLLTLDADAAVPPGWIAGMCAALETHDLVSWPIAFRPATHRLEARILAALQTADNAFYLGVCKLLSAVGLAAGVCFGAAGFRRSLLDRVGGFEALPFTFTEDLAFARAARRAGARVGVGTGASVVVAGAESFAGFVARAVRASAGGGASALAAVLGIGVASLPILMLLAVAGLVPWEVAALRWGAGVVFVARHLARGRAWHTLWAALVYEPVAIGVALAVWWRARVIRHVVWGGVSYARVSPVAQQREPV